MDRHDAHASPPRQTHTRRTRTHTHTHRRTHLWHGGLREPSHASRLLLLLPARRRARSRPRRRGIPRLVLVAARASTIVASEEAAAAAAAARGARRVGRGVIAALVVVVRHGNAPPCARRLACCLRGTLRWRGGCGDHRRCEAWWCAVACQARWRGCPRVCGLRLGVVERRHRAHAQQQRQTPVANGSRWELRRMSCCEVVGK